MYHAHHCFFTLWLCRVGDAAGLYYTTKNCPRGFPVSRWFQVFNGVHDSINSAAL